jgi:hypothetical protein
MRPSVEFGGIKFDQCGISLPSQGLYMVTYGAAVGNPAGCGKVQFQLILSSGNERGCVVPGSVLSVGAPGQLASMSVLVVTEADNSSLVIQNVSSDTSGRQMPVVLNANGGVNAFINVIKLR